jgi:Protein of unknown function (DUF3634)
MLPCIIGGLLGWFGFNKLWKLIFCEDGAVPENFVYAIEIRDGRVTEIKGSVMQTTISHCNDVLLGTGVIGVIACVLKEGQPRIQFEGNFPEGVQQRLRNVLLNT